MPATEGYRLIRSGAILSRRPMPKLRRPVCAVTIAASDSGGGGGIRARLLSFGGRGGFGATVLAAVKVGALLDAQRIRVDASGLRRHRADNVVLDPVIIASDRTSLHAAVAVKTLIQVLLPLCDLVTPNLPEAQVLSGLHIRTGADRREAARAIAASGARAVLITGGHRRGPSVR